MVRGTNRTRSAKCPFLFSASGRRREITKPPGKHGRRTIDEQRRELASAPGTLLLSFKLLAIITTPRSLSIPRKLPLLALLSRNSPFPPRNLPGYQLTKHVAGITRRQRRSNSFGYTSLPSRIFSPRNFAASSLLCVCLCVYNGTRPSDDLI